MPFVSFALVRSLWTKPSNGGSHAPMETGDNKAQPTINDVAARAGVSKKTVSRVINGSPFIADKTRQRIEVAIEELGFVPNPQARALALRRNFLIALLHDNPNAQTVLNFQNGVLSAIRNSDFALVVRPVERDSDQIMADIQTFLERQRPWGAMLLPPISERDDIAELCERLGVRYVRVGSAILDVPQRCVASNDQQVVEQAVKQLIAMGHRKIGFVRGPRGFRSAHEREAGFLAALDAAKIDLPKKYRAEGNYRYDAGIAAGEKLLNQKDRPTAIFCSNDEMAAGVLNVAHKLQIEIPASLSIVGFDDSPTALHMWPPLSTVRWPIYDMGVLAARKLLPEFLDVDGSTLPTTLESSFIARDSTAKPG
jgi:LacI family transcriptional regulator